MDKILKDYNDFKYGNMYRSVNSTDGGFVIYVGIYSLEYNLATQGYFFGFVQAEETFKLMELPINVGWIDLGNFEKKMKKFMKE